MDIQVDPIIVIRGACSNACWGVALSICIDARPGSDSQLLGNGVRIETGPLDCEELHGPAYEGQRSKHEGEDKDQPRDHAGAPHHITREAPGLYDFLALFVHLCTARRGIPSNQRRWRLRHGGVQRDPQGH